MYLHLETARHIIRMIMMRIQKQSKTFESKITFSVPFLEDEIIKKSPFQCYSFFILLSQFINKIICQFVMTKITLLLSYLMGKLTVLYDWCNL
jgi:hypothetical protein